MNGFQSAVLLSDISGMAVKKKGDFVYKITLTTRFGNKFPLKNFHDMNDLYEVLRLKLEM